MGIGASICPSLKPILLKSEIYPSITLAYSNISSALSPAWLIGCFVALASLPSIALSKASIETRIIPGGEVSINEVNARYDGKSIAVSGTGFEVFPHQACGYVEIALLDAKGRSLLRTNAEYRTSYWYAQSPREAPEQNRIVRFSINVPVSATVTSVLVQHKSTGGCEHSWSLQYALDWVVYKLFLKHR